MAEQAQEYKGVSAPLSKDYPSARDNELADGLMVELKAQKNFEGPEEGNKRREVLTKLNNLTKQLVQYVGKVKKVPPEILKTAGGKIFTYGSYRLGVYGPGSDIDTLVIVPKHVTRDDFFNYFPGLLKKGSGPDDITEMTSVADASVPIIKLELCGISIDLIFCSLQVSSVPPKLELTDNNLLRGLSEVDLRCVNGTRVTDRILQLVPEPKVFRVALRAIKLWAQRRAVYGNVVGFPGGVAYAMMVARTCQLYPHAVAPFVVKRFFWLMSSWRWPDPIILQKREDAPLQLREWDPQTSFHDRKHLMPIITPAYPSMNSTHNIGQSTKQIILKEFRRGQQITDDIYDGRKQWKDLFDRHSFFSKDYKHYISVISASRSKEAQQAWSGLCQARLRRLIIKIEEIAESVELAHPFNKGFDRVHECSDDADLDKILQGSVEFQVKEVKTETTEDAADVNADGPPVTSADGADPTTKTDKFTIYSTTYYVGIGLQPNAKSLDISYAIQDYKNIVTSSDLFDSNMHGLRAVHVRNYDLPDDVFAEGEIRPTKTKKPKMAKSAPPAHNKRTVTSAGLDVCDAADTSRTDKRLCAVPGEYLLSKC